MRGTSRGPWSLPGLLLYAVLAPVALVLAPPAAAIELVSLGDGPSLIVEYDRDLLPIRKYTGLHKPVDITPIGTDRLLLVDEGARQVILARRDGTVLWRDAFGGSPLRARPRPGGGFLVTTIDRAIAIREDRTVEWVVAVPGLRVAAPLPDGNFLAASNAGQGWLTEMAPDGRTLWRSKPWAVRQAAGPWRYEVQGETFLAVWGLDVAPDGTIFASDYNANRLRLLSRSHELLRDWIACFAHVADIRFGPSGELVVVSPEGHGVWFGPADGQGRSLLTDFEPWSAALTATGTLLVGLEWRPEHAELNATAARSASRPEATDWYHRGTTVALIALVVSAGILLLGLLPDLRRRFFRSSRPAEPAAIGRAEGPEGWTGGMPGRQPAPGYGSAWSRAGLLALLAGGALFAWSGTRLLGTPEVRGGLARIAVGSFLAGAALRRLDRIEGSETSFSSFRAEATGAPARGDGVWRRWTLLALSIAFLGGCLVLESRPGWIAVAIGSWIAAQVLAVGASVAGTAIPRSGERKRWGHLIALAALLLGSAALAFWEIGNYPDFVHHDHSIYGDVALRILRGGFQPLFDLSASPLVGLGGAAAIALFGPEGWVLRLTGAISGVVTVLATYLVGRVLFNRNVGLIAAGLTGVNHVLLLHARQPFILEPVPLFVCCIFLFVEGLKRQSRSCLCAAGVVAAWTLMAYWAATTLAVAGLLIAALLCVLQPRWMLSRRVVLAWFLLGFTVAFAPLVRSMLMQNNLGNRISDLVVLLNPDGSIRWDAVLWRSQTIKSFGGFLLYPDESAWGIASGRAICSPVEIVLLGSGLVFLLSFRRTMAAAVLIPWVAVSVFLGSAALQNPPSYYHFLAAIVPVLVICALPLERLLAWSARWRRGGARGAAAAVLLGALVAAGAWQLDAAWDFLRRPPERNGSKVYNADERSLVVRFIRENPDFRYYVVRSHDDASCLDPVFLFFASDSDVSDVTRSLGEVLPIPSVRPAPGAAFVVLASRTGDLAILRGRYPRSCEVPLHFRGGARPAVVFMVDAAAVDLALSRPSSPG